MSDRREYVESSEMRSAAPHAGSDGECSARKKSSRRRPVAGAAWPLVATVWFWSLLELPWEVALGHDGWQGCAAVGASKLLVTIVSLATVMGSRFARVIFSFSCGVCVLALAPQLPMEFETFRMGFYLSATECVLKSCVLLTLALHDWPTRALHFDVLNDGLQEGLHVARKTI